MNRTTSSERAVRGRPLIPPCSQKGAWGIGADHRGIGRDDTAQCVLIAHLQDFADGVLTQIGGNLDQKRRGDGCWLSMSALSGLHLPRVLWKKQ